MVTAASVPASRPTSPVASAGAGLPRNEDHPDNGSPDRAAAMGVGLAGGGGMEEMRVPGRGSSVNGESVGPPDGRLVHGAASFGRGAGAPGPVTSPVSSQRREMPRGGTSATRDGFGAGAGARS